MFSSPKLTQWNISIWCFSNSLLLSCKQRVIAVMMGPYKQTPAPSFTSTQILTTGLFSSLVFMKLDELQLYLMGKVKNSFSFHRGNWMKCRLLIWLMLAVFCGLSFVSAVYGNASFRQLFEKKKQLSCFFRLV